MPTFTYLLDGQPHTVTLERLPDGSFRAVIGGAAYTFRAVAGESGAVMLRFADGGSARAATALDAAGTHWIDMKGDTVTLDAVTEITQPSGNVRAARKATSGAKGDLSAQMPGQVREVVVRDGDSVTRGQTLIVLEAMKMEMRITAPADGTIKRVLVQAGEIVERGQRLIEMA